MQLLKIQIINFKSYKGKHTVGPFSKFTCIIGPNGSGKSNILDAISFATNIELLYLRVNNPLELITNGASECKVSLFIDNLCFSKSFSALQQTYVYKINDKIVPITIYNNQLEKINIFPEIKNFIIYQGTLVRNTLDLLDIIERTSNSILYKDDYNKLKENYIACNKLLNQQYDKKKDIIKEMNDQQNLEDKEKEFLKNMQELDIITKNIYILEIILKKKNLIDIQKSYDMAVMELNDIENQTKIKELQNELLSLKKTVSKCFKDHFEIETKLKIMMQTSNDGNQKIDTLKHEIDTIKTKLSVLTSELIVPTQFISELNNAIEKFNNETINEQKEESKLILENYELISLKNDLEIQLQQYENKKNKFILENKNIINNELKYIENKNKINNIIKNLKSQTTPEALDQLNDLNNELKQCENTVDSLTKTILLEKVKNNINKNIILIRNVVDNLKAINPGVHGLIKDLIYPTQSKYEIPIKSLLEKYDNAVVVESEQVTLDCLRYLKETKTYKLTFYIYNKYAFNKEDDNFILKYIATKNEYMGLAQFIFKHKYIYESNEINNYQDLFYKYKEIVTLNGTIYQRNGIISGGKIVINNNLSEKLISERIKVLNQIKNIKNKKMAFENINIIANKIEENEIQLTELDNLIAQTKKIDIDEVLYNDTIKNNENMDKLIKIKEELKDYEINMQFIKEKIKHKETEILTPILSQYNLKTILEYKTRIKDTEIRKELNEILNEKEAQLCKLQVIHNEKVQKYEEYSIINKLFIEKQNQLEHNRFLLKSKQNEYEEYAIQINNINKNIMNIMLTKTKYEEELKDIINFSKLEFSILDTEIEEAYHNNNMNIKSLIIEINEQKSKEKQIKNILQESNMFFVKNNTNLQSKYLKFNKDYELSKLATKQAKDHFNEIATQRKKLFDNTFTLLQKNINTIYKKLAYSLFQTTEFEIDEVAKIIKEGDPFIVKDSIKYFVIPPGKGYTEFKNLSGGEKTLAILSFIFALQKTPPFFILDEADAALDKDNIERLNAYIQTQNLQFIVISLKDYFFKNADSLIGIYKSNNESKILSYKFQ